MQVFNPEAYDQLAALFVPLGKRAVPIYGRSGRSSYGVIGTAVPVRTSKYGVLITASHVVDQLQNNQVVIGGSNVVHRFPAIVVKFTHSRPKPAVDVDVAAIALPEEVVKELSDYYEFTWPGETGKFEDYSKLTLYGFVGCPHSKNRLKPRSTEQIVRPYFYVAREYAEALPHDGQKHPLAHVAFQAPMQRISGSEGRFVTAPHPHGISGCGVWKVKIDPETGEPSRPQLAGIGIEYHAKKHMLIATDFGSAAIVVTKLCQRLDEGLTENVTLELRENETGAHDS